MFCSKIFLLGVYPWFGLLTQKFDIEGMHFNSFRTEAIAQLNRRLRTSPAAW